MNANKRTSSTMLFVYRKLNTKIKKKSIPPRRKREVKIYEQTVSADLEEEQSVVSASLIFDVNQYLKYENDEQQPLLDHALAVRYIVGFLFLNKYDATEKHH